MPPTSGRAGQGRKGQLHFCFGVVPVEMALAIVLAVFLNDIAYFKQTLRAIYFIPYITFITAMAVVWMIFCQPTWGPINSFLLSIGVETPPGWLTDTRTSLLSEMIVSVWRSLGYYMVIFLAGLQTIFPELYEAAKIDGAGGAKQFFRVTLPMVTPIILFTSITRVIFSYIRGQGIYQIPAWQICVAG
jgi:multiple sugar transport system permease protein